VLHADNYGLGVSPQGSGEPEYYWQGSSLGNPKEAVSLCGTRGGAPSPLSRQVRRSYLHVGGTAD
jgi:hypothetical protein